MIISKFGFRKQFGKPEMLGNTSNIYEALIDNDAASDGEHDKPKFQNFIPNITDFSAIMNNDVSAINPEQFNQLRSVANKLGVATPLFLPKTQIGALNSSRSVNQDQVGNMSQNMSAFGGLQSMSRGVINSNVYANQSYMDYTQQLLNEIGAPKEVEANCEDEYQNYEAEIFKLEYPTSFRHLLKILWQIHEKKAFALSNPDGYFYLVYLKMLIKFFLCNFVISSGVVMGICYYSNSKGKGDLDIDQSSWYDLTQLSFSLDDQLVYYVSLIMAIFSTILAYLFMLDFCDEMSRFEF